MKHYTVTVDDNKTIKWYKDGKLHREDGPAVEYADGIKEWYCSGKLHRGDDLPAVEYPNGDASWWVHGLRHREKGPAVVDLYYGKEWYLNGEKLTKSQFDECMTFENKAPRYLESSLDGTTIEIYGKKYKLQEIQ